MKKKILILLFVAMGVALAGAADAAPCQYHNVYGWAWSENVGWISTSCTNSGAEHWMLVDDPVRGSTLAQIVEDLTIDTVNRKSDGFDTYVYTNRIDNTMTPHGDLDFYQIKDHGSVTGTIKFVNAYAVYRGNLRFHTRLGLTDPTWTEGGHQYSGVENWEWRMGVLNKPGGGSWSWANIDDMQIGIEIWGGGIFASIGGKVTQVFILVTYVPPGATENSFLVLKPNGKGSTDIPYGMSYGTSYSVESPPPDYGVDVNRTTGLLSGYAWAGGGQNADGSDAATIGWISFEPADLVGCPSGTCEARLNLANNQVSGWARAISVIGQPAEVTGGWDGWIKLRGTWANGVSLNPTPTPKELEGWAWSDMVIGWISFNCLNSGVCGTSNYKVMMDLDISASPDVPTNLTETWNNCNFGGSPLVNTGTSIILNWNYSDPDGDPQGGYEIWIDSNSGFPEAKFNHIVDGSSSTSYTVDLSQDDEGDWLSQLAWGNFYYWKVKVKDSQGNWSNWSSTEDFYTPQNAFPNPNFTWNPARPRVGSLVDFTSETTFYDVICGSDPDSALCYYSWTFQDATPDEISGLAGFGAAGGRTPSTTFNSSGAKQVILTVKDSQGSVGLPPFDYTCTASRTVLINLPLPSWREIAPF